MWSFPFLYITGNQSFNNNSVIKMLQCVFLEQDLQMWAAFFTREWRNSFVGYIKISCCCSPWCPILSSPVSATVSSGANKRLLPGEKKPCCIREENGYWDRKREKIFMMLCDYKTEELTLEYVSETYFYLHMGIVKQIKYCEYLFSVLLVCYCFFSFCTRHLGV